MIKQKISSKPSYHSYLFFWGGQIFSILGSAVVQFAIIWWIVDTTESEIMLSISSTISLIPQLLVMSFAGVFADLWDRKNTIIIADLLQTLTTLGIIISFAVGFKNIWLIIAMNALRGVFQAFHSPASNAIIPLMVPQDKLSRINGIRNLSNGLIFIIGPVVAASLMAIFSVEQILWLDIITFIIAVIPAILIKIPKLEIHKQQQKHDFWKKYKEGFQTIKSTPGLLQLALWSLIINFLLMPINVLMPFFIKVTNNGVQTDYAFVMIFFQVGSIIGSILCSIKKKWKHKIPVLILVSVFLNLGNILSASAPDGNFIFIGFGQLITGFMLSIAVTIYFTILQSIVPHEKQGRVYSIDNLISLAVAPISTAIAGPLAKVMGIVPYFITCGLLGIITSIIIYFSGLTRINFEDLAIQKISVPIEEEIKGI
ncbi:MAG: MFS transporter [Promethearchaeota archaeon]